MLFGGIEKKAKCQRFIKANTHLQAARESNYLSKYFYITCRMKMGNYSVCQAREKKWNKKKQIEQIGKPNTDLLEANGAGVSNWIVCNFNEIVENSHDWHMKKNGNCLK